MYVYKIGYYSCEESKYFELLHVSRYSNDELHKIIMDTIINVLKDIISVHGEYDIRISKEFGLSYQEIDNLVIDELKKVGFKSVKYQAEWSCFGWQSIIDSDHLEGQRDDTSTRIFNELPAELIEKVNKMRR